MASNHFGTIFKVTTWGESHGKAIGALIDGCPAGLSITEEEINLELSLRAPGNSPFTSPRKEADTVEILSGVFEGKTTGAPISLIIFNTNADSSPYEPIKNILRPGHANFTYLEKYGIFDYRGGGRASARETACRVAAGAIAKKLLKHFDIHITAYIKEIGGINAKDQIAQLLEKAKAEGDSLGGIVEVVTSPLPIGLGDPVYEKLEANLAKAFLSIPATKGFEIGEGFHAARMKGSSHNDLFEISEKIKPSTNHAGGTLGGISTGEPLICKVAFKPTSSIKQPQASVNISSGKPETLTLPPEAKHDPCVAIRAVPVVEAMTALVLADALLMHRSSKL